MRSVAIERLFVKDVRNLTNLDVSFGAGFNVLSGANAQGKTNLLDAVYSLCCSKSFRGIRAGEMISRGASYGSVRGLVVEAGGRREQSVGFRPNGTSVSVDGRSPPSRNGYATMTPVVVFHPGTMALSQGAASERRRLLDRVGLYVSPSSSEHSERYVQALRSRQKTLETRGTSARELDDWELLVARHGCELAAVRERATDLLREEASFVFQRVSPDAGSLVCRYLRTAPILEVDFVAELGRRRTQDFHRGSAGIGPHRDDLALELDGYSVRAAASQGQHRSIVLALKLAELAAIRRVRDTEPILLLDDVSSELDASKTDALLELLLEGQGQVFLSTTRPELLGRAGSGGARGRVDFVIEQGNARASLS